VAEAGRRRGDLAAADLRLRAAEVRMEAARNELTPRLDLEVSGGYTGQSSGLGTLGEVHHNLPGVDVAVGLSFQLPVEQRGARGRAGQAAAALEQRRIVHQDLGRQIQIGVVAAFEAVRNSLLGLRESVEAVRLMEQTVEAEKRKFQLGSSTLFAVNQAEESLTSALLEKIDRQRDHAVSLANLRFETGTIVAGGADDIPIIATRLTSLPE
jgi:outer membrane protein